MLISCLRRDLPPASLTSFFTDAAVIGLQVVGFTVQLATILLLSMMKGYPERFQPMGDWSLRVERRLNM